MLTQLKINNFAIIDEIEISFKEGLTVLTGETGAGKSIIADALDFLLGARGSVDFIKSGAKKAQIEGDFYIGNHPKLQHLKDWLSKNDFEISGGDFIYLSREITQQGSKGRINGSIASVSHLSYLKNYLLDIHQQSEHIELLSLEKQLEILDSYGDEEHAKLVSSYKKTFKDYQSLKDQLNKHTEHTEKIKTESEDLRFEISDIESASINNLDEEEKLLEKREKLLNKKDLIENANLIYELLNNDSPSNVLHNLSQIKKLIDNSCEFDKSFEPYVEIIEKAIIEVKELSTFTSNYCESSSFEDGDLDEIEERLDTFFNLKRKYGQSLEEIVEYYKKIRNRLDELDGTNTSYEKLEQLFSAKEKGINSLSEKLTKSRENVIEVFVNKINEELQTLGFKHVLFVIELTKCELSTNGKENIQFLISTNPDEPPKPLLKVASGGELSRIMLAIKSCSAGPPTHKVGEARSLRERQSYGTMIFDEIDIGVSGEVASSVAKKLHNISKQNQVICITHQPIICAMADSHFEIEKIIDSGTTSVFIKEVLQDEKIKALATLLTPDNKRKDGITEDAKLFAKSLLENAQKIKAKELQEAKL